MNNFDIDALRKNSIEAMRLVEHLLWTKRDEMNSITKKYFDKLLETANLNPKDFNMDYEGVWAYTIGFCCSRKIEEEEE